MGKICDGPVDLRKGREEVDQISLGPLKKSRLCKGIIKRGSPVHRCETQGDDLRKPMDSNLIHQHVGPFLTI